MSNEVKIDRTPHNPTPSRQGLYAKAASYALEAIEVLAKEMREGDNSNARTGAAKALLSKSIPDLRAMELSGKDGERMKFIAIPAELFAKYEITAGTPQQIDAVSNSTPNTEAGSTQQ